MSELENVFFDEATHTWLLVTPATAYGLRLVPGEAGGATVRHVYWGPRLSVEQATSLPAWADGWDELLGEELPGAGGGHRFGPPGLLGRVRRRRLGDRVALCLVRHRRRAAADHARRPALSAGAGTALPGPRRLGRQVTIGGGTGHEGTRWRLRPGQRWRSPVLAGLYTRDGFSGTSRGRHAYARAHVLPHPSEIRPVLYNTWEGTWFNVNEANQRELATIAAELGVELFVVDDGWFGGRTSDRAGLGDWWPNPQRFPEGLAPLIAHVHGSACGSGCGWSRRWSTSTRRSR